MIGDPDRSRSEYLSDDEAARRYEATPEFLIDAIETLDAVDFAALPDQVRDVVLAWYRTTDDYTDNVVQVRDEAERPW